MDLQYILLYFYWIGYVITFLSLLVVGAWAMANKDEIEEKVDVFTLVFSLATVPFLSWLIIILALMYSYFASRKS